MNLPSLFVQAVNRLFLRLAKPATYCPDKLHAQSILIILKRPDRTSGFNETTIQSDTVSMDVRVVDLEQPVIGDIIMCEDKRYRITTEPVRDAQWLVWSFECSLM